jgi:hypothetical protein
LRRGFSPDTVRGETTTREHLEEIAEDAAGFLASLVDREAKGAPMVLADGSTAPRLPGYHRWIWHGEFIKPNGLGGTPALRYRIQL